MIFSKKSNGFSLSELLIVILVIVLLATVSVVALNSQKAKARDAKRISDIRQVQTALEFYKSDEGSYPIVSDPIILGGQIASKLCSKAEGGFVSTETACKTETTYMSQIPSDPMLGKNYTFAGDGNGYDISFNTEKPSVLGFAATYHAHSSGIDQLKENK